VTTYSPTVKSYFSGAGGLDLGLKQAGLDIVQSLEIDPVCCDTLRRNFNHSVIDVDIRSITVKEQSRTDVIVGTFPCNKYSTIADIHGTRTGDDLFLHFFRHIAIESPEFWSVENVPGMRKFPVVMEALTQLPDYYVHVECPVDSRNWLPQRRERLILFGSKKFFMPSAPSAIPLRLKDIIERNPNVDIPEYVYNRIKGKYRDKPIISDPEVDDISPTCVAHYSKDVSTRLLKDARFPGGVRPYTPLEYARLQGFPDEFNFAGSNADIFKQVGNAVAVPMGRWIGKQIKKYFN